MALFTYFDCESDAGAAQKATCLSVAAVTVDENFKIVFKEFYELLKPHWIGE